ncbi:hypothetical protein B0H14DRAFT_2467336 [Mycena olivaceomarginata]|nr:hypothetical protein B0H14DRAFT_2467336 [Mycena olivaceomarginata]
MNTLEPGDISTPSSRRSTDVWFDDGTVVLRAGATLFRVYRGILAAQSPIFRDTFAIPQPATQEMYEGCPVVELHDLPDELGIFLVATHDPAYVRNHPLPNLQTLSVLLRLSTKYEISHIRERMISILTSMYPVSFYAWPARETPEGYTKEEFDDFAVLRLASSYDIPQILPGVYFECCRHDAAVILRSELTLEEKTTCFNATKTLRDMMGMHPNPYGFLYTTGVDCYQIDNCTANRLDWLRCNNSPSFEQIFEEPKLSLMDLSCGSCGEDAKETFEVGRRALWYRLPALFNLPSCPS